MKTAIKCAALISGAAAIGLLLAVGCEEAGGLGTITVTPKTVTMRGTYNTEIFTASTDGALSLPLTWSVSDATLGSIVSSSGSNAVYRRTARVGSNVIIVKDQYNSEGYASVSQQ